MAQTKEEARAGWLARTNQEWEDEDDRRRRAEAEREPPRVAKLAAAYLVAARRHERATAQLVLHQEEVLAEQRQVRAALREYVEALASDFVGAFPYASPPVYDGMVEIAAALMYEILVSSPSEAIKFSDVTEGLKRAKIRWHAVGGIVEEMRTAHSKWVNRQKAATVEIPE